MKLPGEDPEKHQGGGVGVGCVEEIQLLLASNKRALDGEMAGLPTLHVLFGKSGLRVYMPSDWVAYQASASAPDSIGRRRCGGEPLRTKRPGGSSLDPRLGY